jgi:alpha-N-arabinofuranosidase
MNIKTIFAFIIVAISAGAFCNAEKQTTASVTPVAKASPMKYNPMIFGHFIEHFDNQVYGGLYWPGSPFSDEDGFRKDVIKALREIKCPIVRWPGGCYVSDYHWKCGVGPNRQPMWNKAWGVEDPNTFGTDEYIKWCRKVGCEPYICTNAGTGNEEEMSDWVEYCNLNFGKWGRERIKNGYEKPHNVKYWSVGNENWGHHEIGAKTVEQWGPLVRESAKMMRGTDHSIYLLAAALPDENWTYPLLKTAGYLLDYVSVHGYYVTRNAPYLDCMARSSLPEADIVRTIKVLEKAGFGGGKIGIAFDEWNLRYWHHPGLGNFKRNAKINYWARRENDRASTYTMADALFTATFLNTCLRYCNIVKMANFSPIVNTRGAIFVHENGIVKRTTFHVFWMYTNLLEANVAPVEVKCGKISKGRDSSPIVDAVLTISNDGKRKVLAVVNKSPDKTISLDVSALTSATKLSATILDGDSPNAFNDIGVENRVVPRTVELNVNGGNVSLAPHSLNIIKL